MRYHFCHCAVFWMAALSWAGDAAPAKIPDFTNVDPKSLGIEFVAEKKDDDTGFLVGGKNPTERIAKLPSLAGRSIADLERDMRPGQLSTLGFLGKEERLLDILADDNRFVVDQHRLTHQQLARHLHIVGLIAKKHGTEAPFEFTYHGRRFRVTAQLFRGKVMSPFEDGTSTNCAVTVTNVDAKKTLPYSLLVPAMIERYGFYEGKGTPYRVPPDAILGVFDFLKGP